MKDWISLALGLEDALAGRWDEAARSSVIKDIAASTGQAARTLSRSLTALHWLRPELQRLDVALADFPLSLVSTETLRRIAALDRRRLNDIMLAALQGRLTYNAIVEEKDRLVASLADAGSRVEHDVDAMIGRIASMVGLIERPRELEAISEFDTRRHSIALPDRSFKAGQESIALFFPPAWSGVGGISVALCRVFASLSFYNRSYFVYDQPQHGLLFDEARTEAPEATSARLVTMSLATISQSSILRAVAADRIREGLRRP